MVSFFKLVVYDMAPSELEAVAIQVTRLAQQKGHVVAREIRQLLQEAGQPERRWKEVVDLLRESLNYRQGRYHYIPSVSDNLQDQQQKQKQVQEVIRKLLQDQGDQEGDEERRQEPRFPIVQNVKVKTEDNQEFSVLTRDLSPTGIRLVSGRSLLGRKLNLILPTGLEDEKPIQVSVRILWTTALDDGLFENGGNFLEVIME